MYSRFPLSMERLPRFTGFLCLSLRFSCILTALIYIVYSTLGLAVCVAALGDHDQSPNHVVILASIIVGIVTHGVTFMLSFVLLLGILKDSARCVRPWIMWTTFQTLAYISMFVVMNTVQIINHVADSSFYVYILQFFFLGAMVYMLVLVASYYKQLVEPKEEKIMRELADRGHICYTHV